MLMIVLALLAPQVQGKPAAPVPGKDADKQICKRFTETGSLVRQTKVCKTAADWQRERDNIRQPSTTAGSCNATGTGVGC